MMARRHENTSIQWIPAHTGIPGNTRVDEVAEDVYSLSDLEGCVQDLIGTCRALQSVLRLIAEEASVKCSPCLQCVLERHAFSLLTRVRIGSVRTKA